MKEDTIVALATSVGQGGAIAVLRMSGDNTLSVLEKYCSVKGSDNKQPPFRENPRKMLLCHFMSGEKMNKIIDEGLAVYYPAPNSYTGEDVAELFLHGNLILTKNMINTLLSSDCVRIARAGEFTKRAYLNKKMDISRAEAVNQIIQARSDWELSAAQRNLQGEMKHFVATLRSSLLDVKALTEAEIDFAVKEKETEKNVNTQNKTRISAIQKQIEELLKRSDESERIRSVLQVTILGVPNAGKSSLFNRIIGWDRTIVSPEAGTTRDYVSEEIQLNGISIRFVDTAGLRYTEDAIEKEGIRLSQKMYKQSQLIVHVIDGAKDPYTMELAHCIQNIPKLIVLNKWDKENAKKHIDFLKNPICISCETGEGIDELCQKLYYKVLGKLDIEKAVILEERQRSHLKKLNATLLRIQSLYEENAPDEIISLEISDGISEIGAITVPIDNEEVLGKIFSVFCIGK